MLQENLECLQKRIRKFFNFAERKKEEIFQAAEPVLLEVGVIDESERRELTNAFACSDGVQRSSHHPGHIVCLAHDTRHYAHIL